MQMLRLPIVVLLLALAPAGARSDQPAALKPPPVYSRIARLFARQFPRHHLSRASLDDTIAARTWTNYLSALDYDHVYFLQSDMQGFRAQELALDDRLREGDVQFAYDVFHTFKERVRDRYEHVCLTLEKGFDLQKQETWRWQRDDAPWPRDSADRDDIWRRKIKNEYVLRLVNAELAEDAQDEADREQTEEESTPPEEAIRKRYKQVLTVLEDSDEEWVLQKYLSAFAHAYDPHSGYMSFSNLEDFDIEMKLSLVGIGALLRAEDGAAKIVRLIPGGPADRDQRENHLQPGDKIIAVAQGDEEPVDILHQPLYKIVRLIRGEKGTTVVLTVVPASDPTGTITKKVDLVRDEVRLEEQAASSSILRVNDSNGVQRTLGVIELPAFYANMNVRFRAHPEYRSSAYDVMKELESMKKQGVEGVALDLRSNGGGSLQEAIKMTGLFIGSGPTVQVAERIRCRTLDDPDPTVVYTGPLIVLVNRFSASASEILAGALQDYGRAVIVGDSKTHGKGTVQSLVKLGWDRKLGSAKITTASYYRVSGGSTQLRGISSDIVLPSPFDYMDLGEESLPNAIGWSTIEPVEYARVADLASIIPRLRQNSEQRRAADPDFTSYENLLERVASVHKTEELPVALADRRKLAETEKELGDLRRKLAPRSQRDPADAEEKQDPVLRESLRILADFVSVSATPSVVDGLTEDAGKNALAEAPRKVLRRDP